MSINSNMKALIAAESDQIFGFTAFGVGAGVLLSRLILRPCGARWSLDISKTIFRPRDAAVFSSEAAF